MYRSPPAGRRRELGHARLRSVRSTKLVRILSGALCAGRGPAQILEFVSNAVRLYRLAPEIQLQPRKSPWHHASMAASSYLREVIPLGVCGPSPPLRHRLVLWSSAAYLSCLSRVSSLHSSMPCDKPRLRPR